MNKTGAFLACFLTIFLACTTEDQTLQPAKWSMEWHLENEILQGELTLFADSTARLEVHASDLLQPNDPVWFSVSKSKRHFFFTRKDEQLTLVYSIIEANQNSYTCLFADEVIVKIFL